MAMQEALESVLKSRISRRGLLGGAVGLGAGLLIGCGSSENSNETNGDALPQATSTKVPEATPEPKPEPTSVPRNEIVFKVDDNVAPEFERAIKQGAELAREYYHDALGAYLKGTVTYEVLNDPSDSQRGQAMGGKNLVKYNTARLSPAHSEDEIQGSAHEYFHLYQYAYKVKKEIIPWWLYEGAAEVAGWEVLINNGFTDYDFVKNKALEAARNGARGGIREHPINSNLSYASKGYDFGYIAVDFILGQVQGQSKMKTLGELFRGIGSASRNEDWKDIVLKVTGKTIDSISDEFEIYRKKQGF